VEYDMMYVAVTALDGDRIVGVIRVALPLKQIEMMYAITQYSFFPPRA
jgi:hypothetical protein